MKLVMADLLTYLGSRAKPSLNQNFNQIHWKELARALMFIVYFICIWTEVPAGMRSVLCSVAAEKPPVPRARVPRRLHYRLGFKWSGFAGRWAGHPGSYLNFLDHSGGR